MIEGVPNAGGHKDLDLFVLFILHNNYKKQVEMLFKLKIRSGHFNNVFIQSAFQHNPQVSLMLSLIWEFFFFIHCSNVGMKWTIIFQILRQYFTAISSISEMLLKSSESTLARCAADFYREAFIAFDTYYQQV